MPEPGSVAEAEQIVRRAEQDHAYHHGGQPGRTYYGPDGVTPIRTYKTVDNGDGTTVMHIMTLNGWRELPETRANNGRKPDPAPPQPINTSSGGTVSSIEEAKAAIMQASQTAQESQAAFQQCVQAVEQAQQQLMQATEGTSQADASEAVAMLQQAQQQVEEAQQTVMQATQTAEQVAARL